MSNPTPTPTPAPALGALPEVIREALGECAEADRECAVYDALYDNEDDTYRQIQARVEAARMRLVAAITAALSQGAADAARLDWMQQFVTDITVTDADGNVYDHECASRADESFREFIDRIRSGDTSPTLNAAHAGGTHG